MSDLKKTLGPISGAALMLNIVVGAGLLTLPGLAVETAGSLAIYSWLVCAIAAVPLLAVFIIMGRQYPDAGGIAHFAEIAFGRFSYIAASFLFLGAVAFGLPAIAMTGGHYLASIVQVDPAILAVLLVLAAAATQIAAPETASRIASIIASLVIGALLVTITIGYLGTGIDPVATIPTAPDFAQLTTIMAPVLMIFFAFTGWEVAAGTSEEFKNPRRDFPIAMILSFVAATSLYLAMAVLVHGSPAVANKEAAFADIIGNILGPVGSILVALIATIIILANLMGAIWAVSRMIYSLSRERVLPFELSIDGKGRPMSSVMVLVGVLVSVVALDYAGLLAIDTMLHIAGQNFLLLYGISALALLWLAKGIGSQLIAFVAIAIVLGLMLAIGEFVIYPAGLMLLAVLVWWVGNKKTESILPAE